VCCRKGRGLGLVLGATWCSGEGERNSGQTPDPGKNMRRSERREKRSREAEGEDRKTRRAKTDLVER
jgi:hypothetical protein